MKKFWKYIAIAAMTAVMVPMTACDDDDELGPKDKANYEANFVYLDQPTSTYAQVEYKANGDFLSGLTDPLKLVPIRLTKPAPKDLVVEIAIDRTLVDEYNAANATEYKFVEGATIENPFLTVEAGKYVSKDTITVSFGDHSGFINQESDLMLPIVVKYGEGLTASKSSRIFLTFNSSYLPNELSIPRSEVVFKAPIKSEGWEETVRTLVASNAIKLTYNPYEDVTVNIAIDESKVAEYNAANGTAYEFKADAELVANVLTIGPDANGGTIEINTGDLSGFVEEKEYIIPVTVTSVEGGTVEVPEGDNTVYIIAKGVGRELSVSRSEYNGAIIDKPVACTVDGNPKGYYGWQWLDIIDNDLYAYGYIDAGQVMEIDFGKVVNLSSFYVYHWSASYSAKGLKLETSVDGSKWADWGEVTYAAAGSYYVNLSSTEQLQYMRIVFTVNGNYGNIEIDGMKFYGNN